MPDYELCRAVAHAVLAVTSIWVALRIADKVTFGFAAIALHVQLGLVGLLSSLFLKFSNSRIGYRLMDLYRFIYKFALIFMLPLMVTQLYLNAGFKFEYAILHVISGVLPLISDSVSDVDRGVRDVVLVCNMGSLCYLGYVTGNVMMYAAAGCYAVDYFFIKPKIRISEFNADDVFIVGLGLFTYLAHLCM